MTRRPDLTELRRVPAPDLRGEIDARIGRLSPLDEVDSPSIHKKIVVLALTLLVTGGTFFALARAFGGSSPDRRTPGSSSPGPLTGEALAQSLGLIKFESARGNELTTRRDQLIRSGEVLEGCIRTEAAPVLAVTKVDDGASFYCVHGATKLEAWEIAQRLRGHIPTQSEIDEMAAEFGDAVAGSARVPIEAPAIVDAMGEVEDRLLSECLTEGEARAFVGSVMDGLGITGWSVRIDGPVAFLVGQEDAIRAHMAAGCAVYSGSGHDDEGALVIYLTPPG